MIGQFLIQEGVFYGYIISSKEAKYFNYDDSDGNDFIYKLFPIDETDSYTMKLIDSLDGEDLSSMDFKMHLSYDDKVYVIEPMCDHCNGSGLNYGNGKCSYC